MILNLLEQIAQIWDDGISVAIYIRLGESLLHSQERVEAKYDALDISLLFETDYYINEKNVLDYIK